MALYYTCSTEQCQELQSHVQLALSKTKSDIEKIVSEKQEVALRQSEPDEMAEYAREVRAWAKESIAISKSKVNR